MISGLHLATALSVMLHMEGPKMSWNLVKNSWQFTSIYGSDGMRICVMDLEDWGVTEDNQCELEQQQAHVATLITAAPRLLKYLIVAADELRETHATGSTYERLVDVIREFEPSYRL